MNLPFNVIVIDLETAGDPEQRIIEIGAVRLDEHLKASSNGADEFEALIDGRPIDPEAGAVNGITDEMLIGKPKFYEMHGLFEDWCAQFKPYTLFSWSDFDHCTLRDEYRRLGLRYVHSGHAFDVKTILWWEILKRGFPSRTLPVDRALSILNIPFEGQKHRALPDARMEAKLLQFAAHHTGPWDLKT